MAKQKPITTSAYIRIGGQLTDIDTLTEEQRVYVATRLTHTFMTAAFAGRIAFELPASMPNAEEVFPVLKQKADA